LVYRLGKAPRRGQENCYNILTKVDGL
jgi:hypothetical protein